MACTGWVEFDGAEIFNDSRTAQLAEANNISAFWISPDQVSWIEDNLSGSGYGSIANAPWYDSGHAASSEFLGAVGLEIAGLDDSSLESTPIEYVTDGGNAGRTRNTTQELVFRTLIVALSDRGAEFGKRWLDRRLRDSGGSTFCAGSDLRYFKYEGADAPKAHRRDVRLSRGATVTTKQADACSTAWIVSWTMTASDPYEYGEPQPILTSLGGSVAGAAVTSSGSLADTEDSCPVYDYSPIYDPSYPALVAPPTPPNFYPDGWNISVGDGYTRYWARVDAPEPSFANLVPTFILSCTTAARRVRVGIWPDSSANDDQCDPLFVAIANYVPANVDFYIDGERKAAYVWDGASQAVRRTDSLMFGPDATPVQWTAFNDGDGLLVTLDIFTGEGGGTVRADLSLTSKSD